MYSYYIISRCLAPSSAQPIRAPDFETWPIHVDISLLPAGSQFWFVVLHSEHLWRRFHCPLVPHRRAQRYVTNFTGSGSGQEGWQHQQNETSCDLHVSTPSKLTFLSLPPRGPSLSSDHGGMVLNVCYPFHDFNSDASTLTHFHCKFATGQSGRRA